jgi:surfeit locus 1 family protein
MKNMKFTLGRLVFSCPLFLIVSYLLLLVLLLNLGFWQRERAHEKQRLIDKQTQSFHATPLRLTGYTPESSDDLRYRKAIVRGFYDTAQQFLLDNQVLHGKVGYFVLTPFVLEGSHKLHGGAKAVLVNRGWVAANLDRRKLPDVTIKTAQTTLSGRINHFPSVGIKLAGAAQPTETSPRVVQLVDTGILAKKLGYALFSFQLELDETSTEGYARQWSMTTLMPPQQHFGYAIQWFGLAAALTFLFFWYSSKKTHDDPSTTKKP